MNVSKEINDRSNQIYLRYAPTFLTMQNVKTVNIIDEAKKAEIREFAATRNSNVLFPLDIIEYDEK